MTTATMSLDAIEAIDAAADLIGDAERARSLLRAGVIDEVECLTRCLTATIAWGKTGTTVAGALDHLADLAEDARSLARAAEGAARDLRKAVSQ